MVITDNYIYFCGGKFSNFYKCFFVIDNIEFSSSEQAFMYYKAKTFEDNEIADKILKADSPKEAKALGRKVKNYDNVIWNKKRTNIMYNCCYAKFSQNKELREGYKNDLQSYKETNKRNTKAY